VGNFTVQLAPLEAAPLAGSTADASDAATQEQNATQSPLNSRRFSNLKITPVCWRPLPSPEPATRLRRRQSAGDHVGRLGPTTDQPADQLTGCDDRPAEGARGRPDRRGEEDAEPGVVHRY